MAEPDAEEPTQPRLPVGRYRKVASAREAALSLAAKDIPYWIERAGSEWETLVEIDYYHVALDELRTVAEEEAQRIPPRILTVHEKVRTVPLFLAGWVLGVYFFIQQLRGDNWVKAGAAISTRVIGDKEWWRTVTALTLHADLPHLVANLLTGLLFGAFLQPLLGSGCAWFLVLLAGVLGNFANAWSYQGVEHASIGASTAVFGALGILVGFEVLERWRHPLTRNRWSLIVPIGAGLALLAFLGVGDKTEHVDVMAHLWGLACGFPLGLVAALANPRARLSRLGQIALGSLTFFVPIACWFLARRQ